MELVERLRALGNALAERGAVNGHTTCGQAADLLEEALKALEPFAQFAETFDVDDGCTACPDHYPISRASETDEPTIGDCRKAFAILTKARGEKIDG